MATHDVAVVGGGCVGCSIANHMLEHDTDLDVCIIEKEYRLAAHQSGRNSGVLHPGFNYPPGSLKACFATEGTRRMKVYCREYDIPCEEFGVCVTATDERDFRRLSKLHEQAEANGVETAILDGDELREHEPHAAGDAALYCPEAASIDAQQYVYTLAKETMAAGVEFYMGYEVERVAPSPSGHRIHTSKGTISADYVVNAAGLYADRLAHQLGVGNEYRIVPFRGEYYELVPGRRDRCGSMIYPTPDPDLPFLGVHFTRRTDGKVIVGPNAVLAFGREAYKNTQFDLGELGEVLTYEGFRRLMASPKMLGVAWDELCKSYYKSAFVAAAQKLVPDVREDDFARIYAGIRAQLVDADGALVKDPVFEHGPRSTHVLNAVSPGLTSSLPFGEHIAGEVVERL